MELSIQNIEIKTNAPLYHLQTDIHLIISIQNTTNLNNNEQIADQHPASVPLNQKQVISNQNTTKEPIHNDIKYPFFSKKTSMNMRDHKYIKVEGRMKTKLSKMHLLSEPFDDSNEEVENRKDCFNE